MEGRMLRRTLGLVLVPAVFLSLCSAPALAATDAAVVAAQIDNDVKALGDPSAEARRGAEVRFYSRGLEFFPAIEAASQRKDLTPDQSAKLKEIVEHVRPWVGARNRAARQTEAVAQWNVTTALAAYDSAGKKNPKWDDAARQGIKLFTSGQPLLPRTREVLEQAIQGGCDDPLVVYLEARCIEMGDEASSQQKELEQLYLSAVAGMEQSQYPPIRRCFTYLRCGTYLQNNRFHVDESEQVARREGSQQVAHCFALAVQIWPEATKTPDAPPSFLIELGDQFLSLSSMANGVDRKPFFDEIYANIDKAFPNNSAVLAFKGRFLTGYAWDARGGGYANTVTPDRQKLFSERLDMAAEVLTPAWKMNPNEPAAAVEMLTVELGQGKGREVMETWFKRAMKANPDNVAACRTKMLYLEPKWYGSPQDMIAFGHECRDGQNWYAQLPFQLVEAHQTLSKYAKDADAYFHQPEVWEDLESIYKPWLAAWPDNPFARSRYAYYACRCGQWGVARRQFELLGDKAIPAQFGGSDKLEQFRKAAMGGGL
jgi:hypothetical protein